MKKNNVIPLTASEQKSLEQLANMMDTRFRVPGTRIHFGMDAAIGLLPGVGDVAGAGLSLYPLYIASRHHFSIWLRVKMGYRICVDLVVGLLPILGDAFDVWYKSTKRNVEDLLQENEKAVRRFQP